MKIAGIVLIVLGLIALAYQGFTYTTTKKDLQIGDLQVQHQENEFVYLPPVVGVVSVVAGGVLLVAGSRRSIL